jgi:enamine deaminase RidA (YjgF/YER057c/UK114 family)
MRLTGYVSCGPGFTGTPQVIDAASDVLIAAFGERGRHARSAVGVSSLPGGALVEVELIVALESVASDDR